MQTRGLSLQAKSLFRTNTAIIGLWVLLTSFWNDNGVWNDAQTWNG